MAVSLSRLMAHLSRPRLALAGLSHTPALSHQLTARTLASRTTTIKQYTDVHTESKENQQDKFKTLAKKKKKTRITPQPLNLNIVLDTMVAHIDSKDIKVNTLAVEADDVIPTPGSLHNIGRHTSRKSELPVEIITGKYNSEEDGIILNNWKELLKATGFVSREKEVLALLFDNTDKADDIKDRKKKIGCWLAQSLLKTRLPSEVFHRAKILLCSVKGRYSEQEKQMIVDFVTEHGRKFTELSRIINRSPSNLQIIYDNFLKHTDKKLSGKFSLEESQEVMKQVYAAYPNILTGTGMLSAGPKSEVFIKLGSKLNRIPHNVYGHWKNVIEHVLTRHRAGTLDVDYKDRIIHYMVSNGLKYGQDVNWGEVAKLSQFRGSTGYFLKAEYSRLVVCAMNCHQDMNSKDIPLNLVLDWYNSKQYQIKRKDFVKKMENIIAFWNALENSKAMQTSKVR